MAIDSVPSSPNPGKIAKEEQQGHGQNVQPAEAEANAKETQCHNIISDIKVAVSEDQQRASVNVSRAVEYWSKFRALFGSKTPLIYEYTMLSFLQWQTKLSLAKQLPRKPRGFLHIVVHIVYNAILLTTLVLFAKYSSYSAFVDSFTSVQTISCSANFLSESNCGELNSAACEPFLQSYAVRCPANCLNQLAWTPIYFAGSAVQYKPYVVGGAADKLYRGDSWICGAAIHAGVLSNSEGGCVVAKLVPSAGEIYSASNQNGISTFSFNSTYPATLKFDSIPPGGSGYCKDLGFYAEGLFLPLLFLQPFLNPTRKHLYWSTLIWMYLYWTFVSPDTGKGNNDIKNLLASLLPAMAVLYFVHENIAKHTLPKPSKYPLECVLWIGILWFGFHFDMVLTQVLPISALTFSSKMFSNPSTAAGLIALFAVVGAAILAFFYLHYHQDTLFSYIIGYLVFFGIYATLPKIVGLALHMHHYITGLLLLPPTRIQSRLSIVCQSLLLGIFTQGVLKFGFASPFDTTLQANAIYTKGTVQTLWNFTTQDILQGTLKWTYPYNNTLNLTDLYISPTLQQTLGGVSVADVVNQMSINEYSLVMNDIQIYRGKRAHFSLSAALNVSPTGNEDPLLSIFSDYATADREFYVRVAPVSFGNVQDYGDVAIVNFKRGTVRYNEAFSNN
ncbi:UNVERIFIED_CONTAM: hypothetical protein HDU68_000888 [Siphonaria sp. JEL0065]|nr:hypothetical protein HDU68_000888 [Siphonaria sp. JEL0065]